MMTKIWKIAIAQETSKPVLGFHGLHAGFRGLPNVEVVGHADSNSKDIEKRMAASQAKRHYVSYEDMLDKEEPDIMVLCSRHPNDHFEQIKMAAERGVHIYCEKPMTVSLEEADAIIELVDKHGIKLCMAHPSRYYLPFRTMKTLVEDGAIGKALTVYGRGKCDHRGGGEDLIVLGTHILDMQTFMFGNPQYVMADVSEHGRPIVKSDRTETVEPLGPVAGDSIYALFRFDGDVCGTFESRRGVLDRDNGGVHMGLTVMGTRGCLSLRFNDSMPMGSTLRISKVSAPPEDYAQYEDVRLNETRTIPGAAPLESLGKVYGVPGKMLFWEANRYAAWDLIQAIEQDRLPISNQYNARVTIEMIYGIYAAHLAGGRVSLPLANRQHPLES